MTRIISRINKTEENLERFTGKGAESIRKQYEQSMEVDKQEVEDIKEKLKMLRTASQGAEKESNKEEGKQAE